MRWGSRICMKEAGGGRCKRCVLMGRDILFIPRFDSGDLTTGTRWLGSVKLVRRRLGVVFDASQV
jgi:hypothetical protein